MKFEKMAEKLLIILNFKMEIIKTKSTSIFPTDSKQKCFLLASFLNNYFKIFYLSSITLKNYF